MSEPAAAEGAPPKTGMARRYIRVGIGFAFAAVFAVALLRQVDVSALGPLFAGLKIAPLLGALAALVLAYATKIARWMVMLRRNGCDVTFGRCSLPFVACIALNNVLPFRAGDVVRCVTYRRYLGASGTVLVGTLVVERVFDIVALLAIFGTVLLVDPPARVLPDAMRAVSVLLLATAAVVLAMISLPRTGRRVMGLVFRRLRAPASLAETADRFFASIEALASAGTLIRIAAMSILAWVLEGGVFYFAGRALAMAAGAGAHLFSLSVGTLSTLLPSAPGYFGTFHYFVAEAIQTYGAAPDIAAVYAVVAHLVMWLGTTAVGFGCLMALHVFARRSDGA